MTPEQAIKHMILAVNAGWAKTTVPDDLTGEQIDELYNGLVDRDEHWDAMSEVRCSGVETKLGAPFRRDFESKSVAAKAPNGQWVGWTYWYGGGKHAEPSAIDWMNEAYFLDCVEEEKTITVRTFTKVDATAAN